jgi:hypothetical protein
MDKHNTVVSIPGLNGKWLQIEALYDYDKDRCKCPNCGGLGIPWSGWFNCESCSCKAVVEDGRAYIQVEGE